MTGIKRFSHAWFINQIKMNSVGLVSLATALFGVSYNTWLDHHNEINHNMRLAAFEVLRDLSELQTVVDYAHYAGDKSRGNPIDGWKNVVMVRDLSRLLSPQSAERGQLLYATWQQDWEDLGKDARSEEEISARITEARHSVLKTIDNLE
ncbi:MAG TPA: hypothetical protein VIE91_02075 [Methylophilaceae bacterium]|jgi:hypothetical protein